MRASCTAEEPAGAEFNKQQPGEKDLLGTRRVRPCCSAVQEEALHIPEMSI